jgi:hypothetical protein
MKAFWKTYLTVIVLAGLGAYVYFVDAKKPAGSEKAKEKVFAVEKAKVKEIAFTKSEGETVRVVKEGEEWKLSAPAAAPADTAQIDGLLTSIESAEMSEVVIEQPASLATYGLDKPKMTVSVTADAAPLELQLGNKTPDESSVYAKHPAKSRVFTVPSYLEGTFDKKPFDLRDRSVLHVKRDAIKTLEITGPEGAYSLARTAKGDWAFTAPIQSTAGRWSVDGLLGNLETLQMDSIVAEEAKDLKPYGLDKPARTVVIGLQDGGAKRLEIGSAAGAAKDKFYARDASRNLVAEIPAALPTDLAKGMGELRAKRLLDVAAYEVSGIELVVDGQKRVLARSASKDASGTDNFKWKKTAPETKDIETNTVQDVLFQIGSVEVAEFIDTPAAPPTYGFDTPALKVTLSQDGKPSTWFELARKDGTTFARREGDTSVLKLDAKAAELVEAFKKL